MRKLLTTVMLLALVNLSANAQNLSIQDRLKNLEQQAGSGSNVGDLVIQVQQLQSQIAELQGQIEQQAHEITQLKERQKVLYMDVDNRLTQVEEATAGVTVKSTNELTIDSAVNDDSSNQPLSDSNSGQQHEVELSEPIDAELTTSTLGNDSVSAQQEASDPMAQSHYQQAFNQLKQGRFAESARAFEDFIQSYPNHELTDNAYYWLGESYYVTRQYPLALAAFQKLEQQFPLSAKLPDALLKIGYTYHELEDYSQAQTALTKVMNSFPNESVARLAQNRLNLLKREGKVN
ncbi:tol-pal system protein YbgF [Marinicella gelatinilytica]|uniref:tol-pal system protein YbgF n=1 Tax=Marinicella gelatinilytica TaxID=2996017 RepID=UPI002260AC23|nr:tol-pal system protein YbgF [Marinicella gelatinilytica]MCX7545870.1 tol-pal system protein YbgF [Marinicella gelatinilytica]